MYIPSFAVWTSMLSPYSWPQTLLARQGQGLAKKNLAPEVPWALKGPRCSVVEIMSHYASSAQKLPVVCVAMCLPMLRPKYLSWGKGWGQGNYKHVLQACAWGVGRLHTKFWGWGILNCPGDAVFSLPCPWAQIPISSPPFFRGPQLQINTDRWII